MGLNFLISCLKKQSKVVASFYEITNSENNPFSGPLQTQQQIFNLKMQTESHWDTKNHTAKNQVQSLHLKQQLEKANQIFETKSAHTESKNKFLDLLTKNFLWPVLPKKV